MPYPHPALASQLPIAAGAEHDAWEAIVNNALIRAMVSPDPSAPYTTDDVAELEEKISLGHVPENTICPYIAIAIDYRDPEYCISEDPQAPGQKLASVTERIKVYCAGLNYQQARDLGLLVLKSLEPVSTPHVRCWRQAKGGFEYARVVFEDGSNAMEHLIILTFEAMLATE
jgi:hypothetical protein